MSKLISSIKDLIGLVELDREVVLCDGDTLNFSFEYKEPNYELSSGTSSWWDRPYMGDTGSSYSLDDNRIIDIDKRKEIHSFERCPYCNRKNHYNNCVCDGCGANL